MTPEQLNNKIMIDYCYFIATGGGVTFGGGESLLYSEAIVEYAKIIPKEFGVTIETSMNYDGPALREVIEITDRIIIDIKTLDELKYKAYTGMDNVKVLANLKYLFENGYADKCVIRIPEIPGMTTSDDTKRDEEYIRNMGFINIDRFKYVIRDYHNQVPET